MESGANYQITLVESAEKVLSLKQEWDALHQRCSCRSIYNSFDFIYTSIKHFGSSSERLFFICVRTQADQSLRAVFPFSLSDYYWRMGKFRGVLLAGREESDKAYPIIETTYEESIWPEVLRFLNSHNERWQFIDLEEVRENSPAEIAIKKHFNKGYLVHSNPDAISPIIDLNESWDDFWAKHRKMRKRVRKVESSFGDEFRFEIIEQQSDAMQALERYIELEKNSWKSKAKVGIGKSPETIAFYKEYFNLLSKQDQLFYAFLYKGEQLVSAEIAYTLGTTVYFSHGCFNSQFKNLSPGMVSTCLFLKHFFNKHYQDGDFLGGFAQYINPWASELRPSKNLIVIRKNIKTILFYCLDSSRRALYKPIKAGIRKLLAKTKKANVS